MIALSALTVACSCILAYTVCLAEGAEEVSGLPDELFISNRACFIPSVCFGELRILDRPDIACSDIASWRFIAQRTSDMAAQAPEFQIWQENDATSYESCMRGKLTQIDTMMEGVVILQATVSESQTEDESFCEVCAGKVGLYQPSMNRSQFALLHRRDGPRSYFMATDSPPGSSVSIELFEHPQTSDYPLIAIVNSTSGTFGDGDLDGCPEDVFISMGNFGTVVRLIESFTYGHGQQRLIPDICSNTSGVITKWIFAARFEDKAPGMTGQYPELQIWRRMPTISLIGHGPVYVKISGTAPDMQPNSTDHLNVYEYSVDMPFEAGDILGIYQPDVDSSQLSLSFLNDTLGLANYIYPPGSTTDTLELNSAMGTITNVPLVTVEAMVQTEPSTITTIHVAASPSRGITASAPPRETATPGPPQETATPGPPREIATPPGTVITPSEPGSTNINSRQTKTTVAVSLPNISSTTVAVGHQSMTTITTEKSALPVPSSHSGSRFPTVAVGGAVGGVVLVVLIGIAVVAVAVHIVKRKGKARYSTGAKMNQDLTIGNAAYAGIHPNSTPMSQNMLPVQPSSGDCVTGKFNVAYGIRIRTDNEAISTTQNVAYASVQPSEDEELDYDYVY